MMTEKRKTTEALFRQKIEAHLEYLRRAFPLGGLAFTQSEVNRFLDGARFAARTLREVEAGAIELRPQVFVEHPEGFECSPLCDCRPEVENSVEEARWL